MQSINLSPGFPDFDSPRNFQDLVTKCMKAAAQTVPAMAGCMALRERIAEKVAALLRRKITIPSTKSP